MLRSCSLASLFCAALLVAGCNQRSNQDTHEAIMKKSVEKLDEMTAVLKTVQDQASSRAAAPKMQAIGQEIQDLKARGKAAMADSSAEDRRRGAAYEKPMLEAGSRMAAELNRIRINPKLVTPEFITALKIANGVKP